jgi:hypothetical protein
MSASPPHLPRFSLAAICLGHAALLAWAAAKLPWRSGTAFAVSLTLLALLHASTACGALLKQANWLVWSWRALTAASILVFLIMGYAIAALALYVGALYTRLGPAIASMLGLAFVLLGLLTLPIAIWGARLTWPLKARATRPTILGGSLLGVIGVLTLPLSSSAARGAAVELVDSRVTSDVTEVLEAFARDRSDGPARSVAGAGPAACKAPLLSSRLTALVAYSPGSEGPRSMCIQAKSRADLRRKLERLLHKAKRGSTVVVDVVKSVKPLSPSFAWLDALEIRPGIDGACDQERCLTAWQLTLSSVFSTNHPLPFLPDVSFGFSSASLRQMLGSPPDTSGGVDGLQRIETVSFSADRSGVHRLIRTRTPPPALSRPGVEQSVAAAQRYIENAQEGDGSFRYSLDPSSGTEDRATLNLPRQAGTAYALCELGRGPALPETVRRALAVFASAEGTFGEVSALQDNGQFGLGKSALPLLSMLRCRELIGSENDRLIGQLARLMLRLQRPNGSFYPAFDSGTRRGVGDHEILYAAGQAVLSLVLLEQQQASLKGSAAEPLPNAATLKRALDQAMSYYGGPYWPRPLRDFYFIEEGWHCLAARQALSSHRDSAYEQLCLDYVASRARFILRAADTSEPNFLGGYGLSDLFPPYNTATAGVGEALNAAIAIKQKRGLPVDEDKALLRDVMTFLLRAQWSDAGCYACRRPEQVSGGFSQQLAVPDIRIDYVQHAMSAIGHGGQLLF